MLGNYKVSGPAKATTTFPYMNDGSCRDVGGIIAFRLEDKGPGARPWTRPTTGPRCGP